MPALAQALQTRVAGNGYQPCREPRPALEIPDVLKCFHEGVLHRVLSFLNVPDDTYQRPVHTAAVAGNKFFKGIKVAILRSSHKRGIGIIWRSFPMTFHSERKMHIFRPED